MQMNIAAQRALCEQVLDRVHETLENDPHPEKSVVLTAMMPGGKRVDVDLPSLLARKRLHPSAKERRRLLGFQLGNFLKTMGV